MTPNRPRHRRVENPHGQLDGTVVEKRGGVSRRRWAHTLGLPLVALALVGCHSPDTPTEVLRHRQTFEVELGSWTTAPGGIRGEFRILPMFQPRIESLTVRVVGFDDAGLERSSVRVPLNLEEAQAGYALVVRRTIPLTGFDGGVGVEVEANPDPDVWGEFPELAHLIPSGKR